MTRHVRILAFPFANSFQSAQLEAFHEETHEQRRDIIIDYRELRLSTPATLVDCDGKPGEHVQGYYLPRRLRCIDVRRLECTGLYTRLDEVAPDHGARSLRGTLYFRSTDQVAWWGWFNGTDEAGDLALSTQQFELEDRPDPSKRVDFWRDWSPAPALPARLVPDPKKLRERFGGDPISIRLEDRIYHRRLFVGGLDCQHDRRPDIDAVLNLGDEPSRWCASRARSATDRRVRKGEGHSGMDKTEIITEAQWVIERLKANQRVLAHCSAGFNRSVTICCAVLILLEGISAEQALERVREHHPWARPDPHHWLALRWLALGGS
jgi:Dual specificity phosphatase, catalytic domain